MSAADSRYQQLRTHLAYLKLTAAAEALPAHLDGAMKAKATHTEFLEQLLAVEVTAVEARRHAGLLRFANFPAPWRLDDFDFTAQPSVDPALLRELATCRYAEDASDTFTMVLFDKGREVHRIRGAQPLASLKAAFEFLAKKFLTCGFEI